MKALIIFCIVQGCLSAAVLEERAVCSDICPEYYSPLCGTDGKTYSNKCFLDSATCHDSTIQLAHAGRCGTVPVNKCPDVMCMAMYDPVCGTDGVTYSNRCDLTSKYCHGEVTVSHHGPCHGDLVVS